MKRVQIAIIGGGPAGLSAAIQAAEAGAEVLILERHFRLGGQLSKQTHKFFGSEAQYASVRGIEIAEILEEKVRTYKNIEIWTDATVLGFFEDDVLTVEKDKGYTKVKAERFIMASGAFEKFLSFPNNDLPGIYGAGAVQTLMNEYGVTPGEKVLMVGAGNIGLIVSYQLLQAGVRVQAVIDASPKIGGYAVHASKLRRAGVPVLTSHTVLSAHGKDYVEAATIVELDKTWSPISGSEQRVEVDVICISVGLSPLTDLLFQRGVEMEYIPELGGHVPYRNKCLQTSLEHVYIAGDVTGIEEASSAMVEGKVAGLMAAKSLGFSNEESEAKLLSFKKELEDLRGGPEGERIRRGMTKAYREDLAC